MNKHSTKTRSSKIDNLDTTQLLSVDQLRNNPSMRSRKLVFAFFAAAMLFSMIREWNAPVGCQRLPVFRRTTVGTIAR
jgi:hypothetical protein